MNVKDYCKVYNVIPKDICDKIILDYKNNPNWQEHEWYIPRDDSYTTRHNKELSVLDTKNELDYLSPWLTATLEKYCNDIGVGTHIVSIYTPLRLNRYATGEIMSEHCDLIRRGPHDGVPVLSFILAFNDDYQGGKFMMNNEIVELKQGDILIFPSTFLYKHCITEVTSGTRYSGVIWSY